MSNYWDLIILNPILIVAALVSIFFMLKNEKTDLKRKLIYLEIFLFWCGSALMLMMLSRSIDAEHKFTNNLAFFTMITFFGVNFFAIIFKPLATFITGKMKNRRLWYWVGNITLVIAIFLFLINMLVFEELNFILLYLTIFLIGFSLSVNTLHYLLVCEQSFYRLNPIGSTIVVGIIMLFSNFVGNYVFELVYTFKENKVNETILSLAIITTVLALILSFIYKENKNFVGTFDLETRQELDSFKYSYVIYLSLATFFIVVISELSGGLFFEEYLKILLASRSETSFSIIELMIRLNRDFYFFPQILFGYWIYKFLLPKLGYKYHFITSLLLLSIWLSIAAFISNPVVMLFIQFFITLSIAQIFYGLFALAVMWNYRIPNLPVTGFVASSGFLATFVTDGVIKTLQRNKAAIFNYDNDLLSLINNDQIKDIQKQYEGVWTITLSILVSLSLITILIFYFTIDKVLSNYVDIKQANIDMIKLNREQMLSKVETRIVQKEKKNV